MQDMDAWWPTIKVGGVMAGHDYETKPKAAIEVEAAVNDWCESNRVELSAITRSNKKVRGDGYRSWAIVK